MTIETWRRKKYYEPRVMVETARVLNSGFDATIICLTGAELELLRNMTQYLHRRSTFVSEYHENYYLAPDNNEWNELDALVANLEDKLMGCDIDGLIDAINNQTSVLDVMRQCVCQINYWQGLQAQALPDLTGYADEGLVTYKSEVETRGAPSVPPTDEAKCELAQAFWYYVYQMYTEETLPFADSTADKLTAGIVAASSFALLAGFLGIPVFVLSSIVLAVISWAVDGSIEDFINWLLGTKDEIICTLYNNYPDYDAAAAAVKEFIDGQAELSLLDKALARVVFGSAWHMTWVSQDQQENGTWDAYLVPGQCDTCSVLPETCSYIYPCDPADWSGGTVVCHSGWPWVEAGTCRYDAQTKLAPSYPHYIVLGWIPRCVAGDEAEINIGVYDVDTSTQYMVSKTGLKPKDIPRVDAFELPVATQGHVLKLVVKQEGQYGEAHYWCVLDYNPT